MTVTLEHIQRNKQLLEEQLDLLRSVRRSQHFNYWMQMLTGVVSPVAKPVAGAVMNGAAFEANAATQATRAALKGFYEAASNITEYTDRGKLRTDRDLDYLDANMQTVGAIGKWAEIDPKGGGLSPEGGIFLAKAAKFFNEYHKEERNNEDLLIAFGELNSSLADLNNLPNANKIFEFFTDAAKLTKGIDTARANLKEIREENLHLTGMIEANIRDTEHKLAIENDKLFRITGGSEGQEFNGEPSPNVFTRIRELADRINASIERIRSNISP
jgi:hypothetical protein